jgi:hypothetical protein
MIRARPRHQRSIDAFFVANTSGRRATFDEARQEVLLTNGKPSVSAV